MSRRVFIALLVALSMAMSACSDFSVYDVFTKGLTMSPSSVSLNYEEETTFTASGGKPSYRYGLVSGGGDINPSTGVYTAPISAGVSTVLVEDSEGRTAQATITVLTPSIPIISPAESAVNVGDTLVLVGAGGAPPYTFSVLGPGTVTVIDASSCRYTPPTSAVDAVVKLSDKNGNAATALISVIAPPVLTIAPSTITRSTGSQCQFEVNGGMPPYIFSISNSTGEAGVVDGDGLYTAPASISASTVTDTVRASDSLGATCDSAVIVVSTSTLVLSSSASIIEEGKSAVFGAAGGTPPYTYSFSACGSGGTIDAGSGLYCAGSGIGASIDVIKVTDSIGSTKSLSVDVVPSAPSGLDADGRYGNRKELKISWSNNASSADGICLERKTGDGEWAVLKTLSSSATYFIDRGLVSFVIYSYRVRAKKGSLYSPYSNEGSDIPNR
jgi:hypothetical protein